MIPQKRKPYDPNKNRYNKFEKRKPRNRDDQPKGLVVEVRNGNLEQAMRVFKRKIRKSGLIQEMRERQFYTKPSEKRKLAKAQGRKRWLKKLQKMEQI